MKVLDEVVTSWARANCLLEPLTKNTPLCGFYRGTQLTKFKEPISSIDMKCPDCGGERGYHIVSDNAWACLADECFRKNMKMIEEDKRKIDRMKELPPLARFGVPTQYHGYNFFNYPLQGSQLTRKRIADELLPYCANPKGFMLITGSPGRGKTGIAVSMLDALFRYGHTNCLFACAHELHQDWIKTGYGSFQKTLLDKCTTVDYLVIDDLGNRTPTEAFLDALYAVIDERYRQARPTIITLPISSGMVVMKFGDSMASRLNSGKIFDIPGPDLRTLKGSGGDDNPFVTRELAKTYS